MSETKGISVALLSDKPSRNEHLRAALDALGAAVAYESIADTFDREALERSGARVVIVNLDDGDDTEFDEVYDLLDDERYRVLINDGGVSCALSGWDQARWMRHLASKVFGNTEINPPRPQGAEAVPVVEAAEPEPIAPAPQAPVEAESLSAQPPEDAGITLEEIAPEPAPESLVADVEPVSAPLDLELEDEVAPAAPAATVEPAHGDAFAFDLDELLDEPPSLEPVADAVPASRLLPESDDETASVVPEVSAEGAGDFEFEELTLDGDVAAPDLLHAAAPELLPEEPLVPNADALPLDIDLDFDAPPPAVELVAPGDAVSSAGDSSQWSIDALLDEVLADAPPVQPDEEVIVEKMTAAEFLAPPPEEGAPPPAATPSAAFTLELMPLEEAVAPVAIEKASHENWLDPDAAPAAKIRRVWVLGASIGGPDAVRTFLAQIPRGYPALFVLAQHLGDEFVETMTRQLARAIQLIVRTPAHGDRASHGEVLIVPNEKRLLVDANGVVVLQNIAEPPAYRPSIDQVLEDVAERFGAGAGAIIFSGMSDDAVIGCKAVSAAGGRVYVQVPDSCVVSMMVDGVLETGVVQFQGTPEELAQKLNDEPAS